MNKVYRVSEGRGRDEAPRPKKALKIIRELSLSCKKNDEKKKETQRRLKQEGESPVSSGGQEIHAS